MEFPETVIRPRAEHNISRRDIDPDALKVLYRLARSGFTAYLVGGGVRDLLLGRKPKDFDVSTNATPRQIKNLFRNCFLIGRRFRLAHIKFGEHIIETSTFRALPEHEDPHDPEQDLFQRNDNEFGTPQEDALRRDFTINGLFYDVESYSVIDYVGGLEDLDKRSVRCIGDPDIRFREDPVRMIRAVRFASRLGFDIEPVTREAILRHAPEIAKASQPRMIEEIYRLFAYSSGQAAIRLLRETGLLEVILSPVAEFIENTGGDESPFWQYLAAVDSGDLVVPEPTPVLIWGAMILPLFRAHLDSLQENASRPTRAELQGALREILDPIQKDRQIPRKVCDALTKAVLAQLRMEMPSKRRFSKTRFGKQNGFPEAIALYQMCAAADPSILASGLEYWLDLYRQIWIENFEAFTSEDDENDSEGDATPERSTRKRRRRGGRGRRRKSNGDGDDAAGESRESEAEEGASDSDDGDVAESSSASTEAEADAKPRKKRRRGGRRRKKTSSATTDSAVQSAPEAAPATAELAEAKPKAEASKTEPAEDSSKAKPAAKKKTTRKRASKPVSDLSSVNLDAPLTAASLYVQTVQDEDAAKQGTFKSGKDD